MTSSTQQSFTDNEAVVSVSESTTRAARTSKKRNQKTMPLNKQLVLKRWLLSLFGVTEFTALADLLKNAEHEQSAYDQSGDGGSAYLHGLRSLAKRHPRVGDTFLYEYDNRVHTLWRKVTSAGDESGKRIQIKYFQYVALLFSEIYFDAYFSNALALQKELNDVVRQHNLDNGTQLSEYTADDLRKLAFWQATGSGKTHVMHVNILQYLHYAKQHRKQPDMVILLTPNESLSKQHLDNLKDAGFTNARIFDKVRNEGADRLLENPTNSLSTIIEIIDINKLAKDDGDKTVAVSAFEGNNLVLVDEGHRGSSGQEWMEYRRQLVTKGFSCEYSATFGQAFRASNDPELTAEYAKCIIIDYSYRYFYGDGYGKDFYILNLNDSQDSHQQFGDNRYAYLVGSLLTFYQQMRYYDDNQTLVAPFNLSRPFMVFVGGSVTKTSTSKNEASDVIEIVKFLTTFINHASQKHTEGVINRILYDANYLLDAQQQGIFANQFLYLQEQGLEADAIYTDMLQRLFNTSTPGVLNAVLLRKAAGEIALRVGDGDPFGVINVGDAAGLKNLLEEALAPFNGRTLDDEYRASLFHTINSPTSNLSMLIGSRKFTEGWSSFRVSCMGLMKIGKNEGSQIIQLFGRGVRLKGYNTTLKRSAVLEQAGLLGVERPHRLDILETLNVFGVQANYMAEFNNIMAAEDIQTPDQFKEFVMPTRENFVELPPVHVIGLKRGTVEYARTGTPVYLRILKPDESPRPIMITRDYYPRIESMKQRTGNQLMQITSERHQDILTHGHCLFLDFDALYHELVRHKQDQEWYNLIITPESIRELLDPGPENPGVLKHRWYTLFAPEETFAFRGYANVHMWQRMALELLIAYCDAFYKNRRAQYQSAYLEYQPLGNRHQSTGNLLDAYTVKIHRDETALIEQVTQVIAQVQQGIAEYENKSNTYGLRSLHFDRHIYTPILSLREKNPLVSVSPTPMNVGEHKFIEDLRDYHKNHPTLFANKQLYVLRNRSRGHGIGFFNAGNFYPDFIVWLIDGNTQYITFVDPKGLVHVDSSDPKIEFYRTIKDVEAQLRQREPGVRVVLNSCIISVSTHQSLLSRWRNAQGHSMSQEEFNAKHVFFQKDQPRDYIRLMLDLMMNGR